MNIDKEKFQSFIWNFYKKNGRLFAWRNVDNPYYVLVSEIMLQQTQTHRVVKKFEEFIAIFPTVKELADATLRDVINVWQGLGYYRRARFLHQSAKIIVQEYEGHVPQDVTILQTFPGIGVNTASSICAFAFNMPTIFIETNIRTVFIHHFFAEQVHVADKELLPLIEMTVDTQNAREWYYALMDYGVWLKSEYKNPSRKSVHYTKQSKFEGSDRQIRAAILKLIAEKDMINEPYIFAAIQYDQVRMQKIIQQLEYENFIVKDVHNNYMITL